MSEIPKYLIDTHCWLWRHIEPERLSRRAVKSIEDKESVIFFSVVSAWEIVIKYNLNKIKLPLPPADYIDKRLKISFMDVMQVSLAHVLQVENLPDHHKDPFDRLLIAQAMTEKLTVITADQQFHKYNIKSVND